MDSAYDAPEIAQTSRDLGHLASFCHCPGSSVRFGNWRRQIFLDSGILFRFKDS
jgi:hypothetical protein